MRTMRPSALTGDRHRWMPRQQGEHEMVVVDADVDVLIVGAGPVGLTARALLHRWGVRAMVVDKDRQPKWRPARIEEIDQAVVEAMFR